MKTPQSIKIEIQSLIQERLRKFDTKQFKIFYSIIVHCRAHDKSFISTQNLFNLWCELNALCHELAESFPDPYDDHSVLKDFCQAHPYYFIDTLPVELIVKLFAEHVDQHLDTLSKLIQIIYEQDFKAALQYSIHEFGIDHTADELVADLEKHIKYFS